MASQVRQKTWQQSSYAPHQFNHVAKIGTFDSNEDPITHVNVDSFHEVAKVHFAIKNRTFAEKYEAVDTKYEDTTAIVIRHNRHLSALDEALTAMIDGKQYSVIDYSPNDDTYNSIDILTLKHVKKVGGGSNG